MGDLHAPVLGSVVLASATSWLVLRLLLGNNPLFKVPQYQLIGPLKQQVEEWQAMQLSTASAKLLIYQAFIEEESGFPKHLARRVHDLYFEPVHEEFQARTMWSLSNAFTSAFKDLEPIPQYKATAKLAGFLQSVRPQ